MLSKVILCVVSVTSVLAHHEVPTECRAIARLDGKVQGNVTFTQAPNGPVRIQGVISGLPPGQYGFHVHEKGDITGGCLSTGSHYNPTHHDHGHPSDQNRHVGDLGNVEFDGNGNSYLDKQDSLIQLYGEFSIIGRGLVLHAQADDFGRSDHPDSKKTGNAGGRVACGVIGILDPIDGWHRASAASTTTAAASFLVTSIMVLIL